MPWFIAHLAWVCRALTHQGPVVRFNEGQAMALHEPIDVSLATHPMDTAVLSDLQDKARVHNERHDITGRLSYHGRAFLQLIKGAEADVMALFEAIWQAPRHQQIDNMWNASIAERSFCGWAPGFVAPNEAALQGHPGDNAWLLPAKAP